MKADFGKLLKDLDHLIRAGKILAARESILRIRLSKVPREYHADLALLTARTGLPELGVRVLNPRVRPSGKATRSATDREKAEYANCLIRIGAGDEALELLEDVPLPTHPNVALYRAIGRMARWDYAAAIPLLASYIEGPALEPYQILVGKVNLASALVYERRHVQADFLLRELIHETSLRKAPVLLGNALELSAASFVLRGDFPRARRLLTKARQMLAGAPTVDAFFVSKWEAISHFLEGAPQGREELAALRSAARDRRHWETLRDCDRHEAVRTHSGEIFQRVYFGTPYPSFRARLRRDFGKASPGKHYRWQLGPEASDPLGLLIGEPTAGGALLKPGQSLHRLLCALCSDFYHPLRLVALHAKVFPGEYFNPDSSVQRVHQSLVKLRKWLRASSIPLDVRAEENFFRVVATGNCTLLIPNPDQGNRGTHPALVKLAARWRCGSFALRDASQHVRIAPRTLSRLLGELLASGELEKIDRGRNTRYRFSERFVKAVNFGFDCR